MSQQNWLVPMVIGVVFIILGVGAIIWGKNEEKNYYNSLSDRSDAREFMEHWPPRPQFGALKIGGWIAIAVGLLLAAIGINLWL